MEYLSIEYISIVTGFLLVLFGIYAILTQRNIIKIIIGFSLFDTGIHILMVSIGYIKNRTAPILDGQFPSEEAASRIVDPVPQALVLTAIVIGLGVTALMLAFALKLHKQKNTLEINKFNDMKW